MISNLISSIFTNPVTVIFLVVTILYSVVKILENKSLYDFINENLGDVGNNYRRSRLYSQVIDKYNGYMQDVSHADINITSLTEEIVASLTFKNKFVLDKVRSIKNAPSICILLGVLGTFVGLSTMLLSVNTNDLINSLPQTISSMQTAFITSIFGIVFSLVLGFIVRDKDCEHVLIQLMLKIENLLTAEVTHSKSEVMDSKVEDVKNTIKQISKSIESIEKFDKISKDLNDFNDEFISGIEALKDLLEGSENSIKTFDQSVRKLDKQFSIMNIKFTKLFDKYDNQEDINKEILLDIKESAKNIYDSTENQAKIKEYIKNINAGFAIYERSAQDLLTKLISHEGEVLSSQVELKDQKIELDDTIKNLSAIVSSSSKDIEDKLSMIFNYIDIYKEAKNIIYIDDNMNIKDLEADFFRSEEIYEVEKENEFEKSICGDELND